MDNRFSVKDFLLFLAVAVVLLVLLITMYMIDRQWLKLSQMETLMQEQAGDLRRLRGQYAELQRGGGGTRVTQQAALPESGGTVASAFDRSRRVTTLPDYAEGDWLVRAFASSIQTLTPLVSSDAYASSVQAYVLESLIERDPETLAWQGRLAERWTISDDGLTFTFFLRSEATFSDGVPVTADDVAFTYAFIMDERIKAPRSRAYLEKIASVEAVTPQQVVFTFKEPYYNSLSLAGGMEVLAKHVYGPYLDHPEQFNQSKGLLFGSGPYRLPDPENWSPDQGVIELQRNPRYWAPVQPSFERLVWKIIENEAARLTSYRNGDIDVYSAQPREYQRELLNDETLMAKSKSFEYLPPTSGYRFIGWNQQRQGKPTPFADKRVRQAMTYLTDKQRIVDEIMLGYGNPVVGPFSPQSEQHATDLPLRGFNVEKAAELLKAAGFADRDGDGVLEDSTGSAFEFELIYPQSNEQYNTIALFLRDSYARAGVKLIPKPTEWAVMLELIDKKNFEAIALGWTGSLESDLYQIFHSSQTKDNGDNFVNYSNPELDQLIDKARVTVDEAARMPLWQSAERLIYEDQPYTFLVRSQSLVLVDQRMHNTEVTPVGLNISETPVGWYVPEEQQKYH